MPDEEDLTQQLGEKDIEAERQRHEASVEEIRRRSSSRNISAPYQQVEKKNEV
jgi:hypothetical protein